MRAFKTALICLFWGFISSQAFAAEEVDLNDPKAQPHQKFSDIVTPQMTRQRADQGSQEEADDNQALDDARARLRDELRQDRAEDFQARSARSSAGVSEKLQHDLQSVNLSRARQRGKVVLAQRGEGLEEASEEAKTVSNWAREKQLTQQGRQSQAGNGGKKNLGNMVNGMQAWASGKSIKKSRKADSDDEESK